MTISKSVVNLWAFALLLPLAAASTVSAVEPLPMVAGFERWRPEKYEWGWKVAAPSDKIDVDWKTYRPVDLEVLKMGDISEHKPWLSISYVKKQADDPDSFWFCCWDEQYILDVESGAAQAGYRVLDIEVEYNKSYGKLMPFYSGILTKNSGVQQAPWKFLPPTTSAEFGIWMEGISKQGYRMLDFEIVEKGREILYCAIAVQDNPNAPKIVWQYRNFAHEELQELSMGGLSLVDFEFRPSSAEGAKTQPLAGIFVVDNVDRILYSKNSPYGVELFAFALQGYRRMTDFEREGEWHYVDLNAWNWWDMLFDVYDQAGEPPNFGVRALFLQP